MDSGTRLKKGDNWRRENENEFKVRGKKDGDFKEKGGSTTMGLTMVKKEREKEEKILGFQV